MKNNNIFFSTTRLMATSAVAAIASLTHSDISMAAPTLLNNVQVNQAFAVPFSQNKQNEPSLAQNPTNPLNLIAGSNDQINEPVCTNTAPSSCLRPAGISVSGYYASFDGGITWPYQGLLDLSVFGEYAFGDPIQVFDSQGNAFYGTLAFPKDAVAGAKPSDLFVAKSTDGGKTYSSAAKVSGASNGIFDDKDGLAADANPFSPFHDNVYAVWTKLAGKSVANQILFARSTDGGATWSTPAQLTPADSTNTTLRSGAAVQVGRDGTVYVIWVNTKGNPAHPSAIHMTISRDGGKTFLPLGHDITVALVTDDGLPLSGTSFRQNNRVFPSLTVAPNGTLHVIWCNHINNHAQVLATKSSDGGQTWSAPVVAGNLLNRSAFFASVAADKDNKVNVIFQALDDKPSGTPPGSGVVNYDSYFVQSTNGGTSFGSPMQISTESSDPDGSSVQGLNAQFLGDYITAVADSLGGRVFAVWTDSRNASPCIAVDAFRAGKGLQPNVITDCPITFGNTDIFLGTVNY